MLIKNDVFIRNGAMLRVLHIDAAADLAWVFPIADEKGLPRPIRYSALENEELLTGIATTLQAQPSAAAIGRATIAWTRIAPLVDNPAIFDVRTRNALIKARAAELKCSEQTLLKDLRRYWSGGQTSAALMGQFHRCGLTDVNQGCRRGRKPKDVEGYTLTAVDHANMKHIIEAVYLKKATVSVPAAYQRLREKHYSYLDGNGIRTLKPAGEVPTLRQFRFYLDTRYTLEQKLRGRLGHKDFERDHRAKPGWDLQHCHGIAHIYELDATIADVWLVHRKNRAKIIGKPTLYLIYDKFSRLVVGFYIGLEAPSWPAARLAIASIAEDKATLCKRYGVPYNPADWPATGCFPQTFVGDRGEMLSQTSSTLATNLSIIVKNEPALRPDRKGTVECGFRVMQHALADTAPGYEPAANVTRRRGKKYDQDACLTLDEFTAMFVRNIIAHNNSIMKNYPLTTDMLERGVRPTPIEIWNDDLRRGTGSPTRFDEETVRLSLLPKEKATVTREGILLKGCYYTCPEAVERGWFVKAGQGRFKVDVLFDKRLVDSIIVLDAEGRKRHIGATLAPRSVEYKGMSFDEVAAYEYLRKATSRAADEHNAHVRNEFHADADAIAAHAKHEMLKEAKGKSRASRRKDVAADRMEERQLRRQEDAVVGRKPVAATGSAEVLQLHARPSKPTPTATSAGAPPNRPLSLAERLAKKHQEMKHG